MFVYKCWSDSYERYFLISTLGMQAMLVSIYESVRKQEGNPSVFSHCEDTDGIERLLYSEDNSILDHVLRTVFEKGKAHEAYNPLYELFFPESQE